MTPLAAWANGVTERAGLSTDRPGGGGGEKVEVVAMMTKVICSVGKLIIFFHITNSSWLYISIDFPLQIATFCVVSQRRHQTIYIIKAELAVSQLASQVFGSYDINPRLYDFPPLVEICLIFKFDLGGPECLVYPHCYADWWGFLSMKQLSYSYTLAPGGYAS